MGRDKLSLPIAEGSHVTVLDHVTDTAAQVADRVWLLGPSSTDGRRFSRDLRVSVAGELVSGQSAGLGLQVIADKRPYQGPLAALANGWEQVLACLPRPDWVWVLAGDLPGVQVEVLCTLAEVLQTAGPMVDGVLALREGRWQPLLGCYRFSAGKAFAKTHGDGEQHLSAALERLTLRMVDGLALGWPDWWLRPVHTPEDYREWLRQKDQDLR